MTALVISPLYPISDAVDTSHRAGWARYLANELDCGLVTTQSMSVVDTLKRGDELYCYHGMEFKGQLNLQSGLTEEILARVKRVLDAKKRGVKFYSLDVPMPDYGALLEARGMDETSSEALTKLCRSAGKILAPNLRPKRLVIGDSHALSQYTKGSTIVRNDGQTLFGALCRPDGLMEDIKILDFEWEVQFKDVELLTVYYGNIDVRHHLMRQQDPKAAIKELVDNYGKQLENLRMKTGDIEIVLPLPIEDESRPIPKSGWYKGAAFAGSWSERHQIRLELRDQLKRMAKKRGFKVYEHPKHFTGKDGKLTFEVMEKPRSVHIRPSEYRLIQEGDEWRL